MSRTPASITQADIARVIRAAKQAGAHSVEVKNKDGHTVTVNLSTPADTNAATLVPSREIDL
jgi:hypothetical protein